MLANPENCIGCLACYAACNKNAIVLKEDYTGTLFPKIDVSKCINCGKCSRVCSSIHQLAYNNPKVCYACYSKKSDDVISVSSGGIATVFNRYITQNGGVAFGGIYDSIAKIDYAESIEDIEKFKGSKYVYCFPDKIYAVVLEKLKEQRTCLFIGTPCQIAGLRAFLGKDYKTLITVDLICHGTPPFCYLDEWIRGKSKSKIKEVSFRGKYDYILVCKDEKQNIVYSCKQNEDTYFTAFSSSLINREICYSCPYAKLQRVSDITIGDFWGLSKEALNSYNGKKSVVLLNTQKGIDFFEKAKQCLVYEERTVMEAVSGNKMLRHPTVAHKDRKKFLSAYKKKMNFNKAIKSTNICRQVSGNRIKNTIRKWFNILRIKVN